MRQIDNMTPQEIETLSVKGMTAPRTASERNKAQPRKADAATHSTLPWRRAGGMVEGYSIIAGDGKCVVYGKLPSSTTNLIVRAVNHADKLAEALRDLEDVTWRIGPPPITKGGLSEEQDWVTATRKAKQALAAYEAAQ